MPPRGRLVLATVTLGLIATALGVPAVGAVPTASTRPPAAAADPLFAALDSVSLRGPKVRVRPAAYSAYDVDVAGLRDELAAAPGVGNASGDTFQVSVPDPSGALQRFAVVETVVGEPGFEALHPEIRTYAGNGIDDPALSVSMDVTPMGFHASVRKPGGLGAWYIDPAFDQRGETRHLSYYGASVPRSSELFVERDAEDTADVIAAAPQRVGAPDAPVVQKDFRLAFTTDPTYAAYFGSANVAAAKATLLNRVNQVYMDDLAIRFLLVTGTDKLNLDTVAKASGPDGPCGANPCMDKLVYQADPATAGDTPDGCTGDLLNRNIFITGQIIGADKFDIGHIGLGVNGGGVAGLGVVGGAGKARGCTGLPFPKGDFYAVDYFAHEVGHQMGGNHTFNGNQLNCDAPNRNTDTTLVEPGSGSSVMAYAGICQQDNLQPHSDPYFSFVSIEEITARVATNTSTVDEQQVVNLKSFDGVDAFTISCAGCPGAPVLVTNGANYSANGLATAISTATGKTVTPLEVTDYDSGGFPAPGSMPSPDGFTVDFTVAPASAGVDVPTLVITPTVGTFTTFTGTTINGGQTTNEGVSDTLTNINPVVVAPADKSIPIRTPFTLTGSGTDDNSDPLIYLWEQTDTGSGGGTALVDNNKIEGPLFRMFGTRADVSLEEALQSPAPDINLANGNPSRTFPDLAQVVAGNTNAESGTCPAAPAAPAAVPVPVVDCFSEFLPTAPYAANVLTGGELNFRLSARDQKPAGGGYAFDDVSLTIDPTVGPFLVTSRSTTGAPVNAGTTENVTWDTAGTNNATYATNVKLSLSVDGGVTFPFVLAASTANDGTEPVTWPSVTTTQARVKVEAVGNYFFDVNNADFAINGPLSVTKPANPTVQYSDPVPAGVTFDASSPSQDGDQLTAAFAGLPGLTVTRSNTSTDGVRPGTATFTLTGTVTSAPATYPATLTVTQPGGDSAVASFAVTVTKEDATATYTGDTTASGTTATVPVILKASVGDAADTSPGNIANASVTFVNRTGGATLCTSAVTGGPATGTAQCTANLARNGPLTTYTVGTVVGGRYTRNSPSDDATVTITSTPGDTTPPDTAIVSGPADRSFVTKRRVTYSQTSSETGSSFVCSLDGQSLPCGASKRLKFKEGTHVYRVQARDAAGNLDPTPAVRVFASPFNDGKLRRATGGWKRIKDKGSYRGAYMLTSAKGEILTLRKTGITKIALVAHTGPGFGKVKVMLGSVVLAKVNLGGSTLRKAVLIPIALSGKQSGTVSIVTTTRKPVRIDGLGLLTG